MAEIQGHEEHLWLVPLLVLSSYTMVDDDPGSLNSANGA